jgi:alpha-ketoglutarate-dependent taurine dioxygenase
MKCIPMARGFGALIEGVQLSGDLDSETMTDLLFRLYRHRFLVIPDQDFDPGGYIAFARRIGRPITFFDPGQRDHQWPEIILISNSAATIEENRDFALHWHTDGSYEDPPASVTMLYGVEAPAEGNETLFCDMVAAYDALDPAVKAAIEDLVVIHGKGDQRLLLAGEKRGRADVPPIAIVHHRLVGRHPVTGEQMLYATAGSARGIVGMGDDEALQLLSQLKVHATQERFVAAGAARTRGVLIWDNYAVLHSATPTRYSDEDGERRRVYRISTRDIPLSAELFSTASAAA